MILRKNYYYYVYLTLLIGIIIGIIVPMILLKFSFFQLYILVFILLIIYSHIKYNLVNILNPISFYLLYYFIFVAFGGLFAPKYSNRILINEKVFLLVLIGALFFILGSMFYRILSKRIVPNIYKKSIYSTWEYNKANYLSLSLILIGSMLTFYYYYLAGTIPILHENADYFRVQVKEGKSWLYLLSYAFYLVGLLIFSLNNMNIGKYKTSIIISFLGSIIFIGLGYRSPAFQLLLMSYVLYSYFKYKKIKLFRVLIFGLILLFLIGLTGSIRSKGVDVISQYNIIWLTLEWRFFVQISNIQMIFDWISNNQYLYGKSLVIDLLTLLPGYQPSFAIWLKDVMGMDFAGGFTTTLVGEAYANLGFLGVIILSLLMGFIGQGVYYFIMKKENINLYEIGVLLLISFIIGSMVSSGIFTALKNVLLPFLGLYLVITKLFLNKSSSD
jgi:oligosaccharide repeat unit polymerase